MATTLHLVVAEAAPAPAVPTARRRARVRATQLPTAPRRPTERAAAMARAEAELVSARDWTEER